MDTGTLKETKYMRRIKDIKKGLNQHIYLGLELMIFHVIIKNILKYLITY